MSKGSNTEAARQPLVSIVMPCYNSGRILLESIASAQAQSHPAVELIVVDDGSTDHSTLAMLDDCRNAGVRVIHQPNGGVSSALNTGIRAAAGTYFMPLGDDLIDPSYVSEAVEVMERDNSVGIVYCNATLFGSIQGPWLLPPFTMKRQLTDNCIFAAALFRTSDWQEVGGYDEKMRSGREDHDFIMRILSLGRSVHRLDGVYFHYRQGNKESVNAKVGQSRADLIDAYAQILRNNTALYAAHAHLFWDSYFDLIDERNDLRNRYRALERLRNGKTARRVWPHLVQLRSRWSAVKRRLAR